MTEELYELRCAEPSNKPILYLDVDGVLISFPPTRTPQFYKCHPRGSAARRVEDFIPWVDANFEVRWLTAWAMRGRMDEENRQELSDILVVDIPTHWDNPMDWGYTHTNVPLDTYVDGMKSDTNKINGLDFTETRPWYYLDDETFEQRFMPDKYKHRFIKVDCSTDRNGLMKASLLLWGKIPGVTFPQWALI